MEESAHPNPASNVRFGPFEVDLRRGELRKEGRWIRLQAQPFQILRMLLESPGEVVSREEIRKRLWPDDTVVEFDHRISVAVRRLRDALQDSADNPRYIQTFSRRGYRFIGELANRPAPADPVALPAAELIVDVPERDRQPEPVPKRRWFTTAPGISVPVLLAAALFIWAAAGHYGRRAKPTVAVPLQPLMRLNLDLGSGVSVGSARGADLILSPDGTQLVYVSQSKLNTRRLDQTVSTELPHGWSAGAFLLARWALGRFFR
jgi:DNA-binding winged helix-turn-helix (wHTH) protein